MTRILPIDELCQDVGLAGLHFANFISLLALIDRKTIYLVMNIKPIRSEKDYRASLRRIDELIAIDSTEGTAAFDELDLISTLVEAYESIHYKIDAPDPIKVAWEFSKSM